MDKPARIARMRALIAEMARMVDEWERTDDAPDPGLLQLAFPTAGDDQPKDDHRP